MSVANTILRDCNKGMFKTESEVCVAARANRSAEVRACVCGCVAC